MIENNISTFSVVGKSASRDLKTFIDAFLHLTSRTPESKGWRKNEWKSIDIEMENYASLGAIEHWVLKVLRHKPALGGGVASSGTNVHLSSGQATAVHKKFQPIYSHAFFNAKHDFAKFAHKKSEIVDSVVSPGKLSENKISRVEFRILIAHICYYACAYDAFSILTNNSIGNEYAAVFTRKGFLKNFKKIRYHGFGAFTAIPVNIPAANVDGKGDNQAISRSLEIIFGTIDVEDRGVITFDQWCRFLKRTEYDENGENPNTFWGDLLNVGTAQKDVDDTASVFSYGSAMTSPRKAPRRASLGSAGRSIIRTNRLAKNNFKPSKLSRGLSLLNGASRPESRLKPPTQSHAVDNSKDKNDGDGIISEVGKLRNELYSRDIDLNMNRDLVVELRKKLVEAKHNLSTEVQKKEEKSCSDVEDVDQIKFEMISLKESHDRAVKESIKMKDELKTLQDKIVEKELVSKENQDLVEILRSQQEYHIQESDNLKSQVKDAHSLNARTVQNSKNYEVSKLEGIKVLKEKIEKNNTHWQKKVACLNDEVECMKEQISINQNDTSRTRDTHLLEISHIEGKLQIAQSSNICIIENHTRNNLERISEIDRLQQDLNKTLESRNELLGRFRRSDDDLLEARGQLENISTERDLLKAKVCVHEDKTNELESKTSKLNQTNLKLLEDNKILLLEKDRAITKLNSNSTEKDNATAEMSGLNKELDLIKAKICQHEDKTNELESNSSKLNQAMSKLLVENKTLLLEKDQAITKFNDMTIERDTLAAEIACRDKEFEAALDLEESVAKS